LKDEEKTVKRGKTFYLTFLTIAVTVYGGSALGDGYAILTTAEIIQNSFELTNFVAHREACGYDVQVVSNGAWGGGVGDTAADRIRAWLQQNYTNSNAEQVIDYVLLIGDPRMNTGQVPMKRCHTFSTEWNRPTDYYYAELTCDWNGNGVDGFGQWDCDFDFDVDHPAESEVFVGRIPCYGDVSEVDAVLAKIIAYESATPEESEWRKAMLLAMDHRNITHNSEEIGESIKHECALPIGGSVHRVYDRDLGYSHESTPCTNTVIVQDWTGSAFGAVFWFSHGTDSGTYHQIIEASDVPSLDDTHPVFTFQGSCHTGDSQVTNNLAWLLLKHGALCAVASTSRASYEKYSPWKQPEMTPGFVFGYARNLMRYGLTAGEALQAWKTQHDPRNAYSPGHSWRNYLGFNVYGGPASSPYRCASDRFVGPGGGF